MTKIKIIAEIGVNHNGSIQIAKKLIDASKKAGADYVKFQTFKTNKLLNKSATLASYQKKIQILKVLMTCSINMNSLIKIS